MCIRDRLIGLALSNAIVALSGGLLSQYSGFSDVNMGRGGIVIGLAAVITVSYTHLDVYKRQFPYMF